METSSRHPPGSRCLFVAHQEPLCRFGAAIQIVLLPLLLAVQRPKDFEVTFFVAHFDSFADCDARSMRSISARISAAARTKSRLASFGFHHSRAHGHTALRKSS